MAALQFKLRRLRFGGYCRPEISWDVSEKKRQTAELFAHTVFHKVEHLSPHP